MTRIYTLTQIHTPIDRVFDYVTAPGNWPGRYASERPRAGGRSRGGTITYTATPHAASTNFEREFVYTVSNPWLRLLDRLVLRHRIEENPPERSCA